MNLEVGVVKKPNKMIYRDIQTVIESLDDKSISDKRKAELKPLIEYVQTKLEEQKVINLNFICTHNSRRSQLTQIWAKVAAHYYGIDLSTYSGGMEVTAFHQNAVEAMKALGFKIEADDITKSNPMYLLSFAQSEDSLQLFSKKYDDEFNPNINFAAIMTCSHADGTCPFVVGMDRRISLPYDDPKEFDGQENSIEKYKERSIQIATEMFYAMSNVNHK